MRLSGERIEIAGVRSIAKLLDVGIVDLETKLIEFYSDVSVDASLEFLTF